MTITCLNVKFISASFIPKIEASNKLELQT